MAITLYQPLVMQRCQMTRILHAVSKNREHSYKIYRQTGHWSINRPSASTEWSEQAKQFSEIPGPLSLPILGTLLPYKLGFKKSSTYHKDISKLFLKYGPIVREVFGSQVVVHLFDPADVRQIYETEGKMPYVPPLQETTQMYRRNKDMSSGLGNSNGDEWYKLRLAVRQMMLRPKEVSYYYPLQDGVAKKAVSRIQLEVDSKGEVSQLHILIGKWILESSAMCCLEKSLGCFNLGDSEELAKRIIESNTDIFKLSSELKFTLRLHRFFNTPKYSKLHGTEEFFYGTSINFLTETIDEIKVLMKEDKLEEGQFNFLTYLMSRKDLSEKDVIITTFSLFTDGLSTTAPTLLASLHCLALNPKSQELLYQEISRNVAPDAPITVEVINKLQYIKAFLKEVFRFYPIGEAVQRLPQKDMVLSGYHVPAGTWVDLNTYVWLQSDRYFEEPHTFRPERWLRETSGRPLLDPYVFNPFSIGTRMCIGRRFAEQDLYIGLCRVLQKFRLEATNSAPLEQEWNILLSPKKTTPIRFVPRE